VRIGTRCAYTMRMLHPDTDFRFINPVLGLGVVATALIPQGTIVWVRDSLDRTIPRAEAVLLPDVLRAALRRFAYIDRDGNHVLCWDHARYTNHSCRPNCLSPGWELELAVRDILPGEQLTDDYGSLNLDEPLECECGAEDCRGRIESDDLRFLYRSMDERLELALARASSVSQPLWELVAEQDEIAAALSGGGRMPSSSTHFRERPANPRRG